MEAIILAGGLGTRLRSVISDKPKALAPINGQPFLKLQLSHLASHGFRCVILATGYLGSQIQEVIGSRCFDMDIFYSHEEIALGTGGAIAKAMNQCTRDSVFAMNGDTWIELDFQKASTLQKATGGVVMVGIHMDDVSRYGRMEIVNGHVVGLSEKSTSGPGWINGGCYILPRGIFSGYPAGATFSMEKDFLPAYLARNPAPLFHAQGNFHDIGVPEDYRKFENFRQQAQLFRRGQGKQ